MRGGEGGVRGGEGGVRGGEVGGLLPKVPCES